MVLYDPQAPDVGVPGEPVPGPTPPVRLVDRFKMVLMGLAVGLAGAGVFWLGWRIDVPVVNWLLMIVGGFPFALGVFLIGIFVFVSEDDAR